MKMKPKVFTQEQLAAVKVESATQTTDNVTPKSTDPVNFPVFDIPVNAKVLVYVPKHTVMDEEGNEDLRMDKPLIHMVMDGKRFKKMRCVRGLSEAAGYSGTCPICEGEGEPWDLANEEIKDQCRARGLDPNASDDEAVKTIKRDCYSKRVIKQADRYYTFPIVVIETDPNNFKRVIMDEETGMPKHKAMWYTISASSYEKKWKKALEGMEDEPNHPGGECFILNYTYESKSGEYNKRDSARELQVVPKKISGMSEFYAQCDKETEEWDAVKAFSTVYDNMYYAEEDLEKEVARLLTPTREKLALYALKDSAPAADTGFQLNKPAVAGELGAGDGIGNLPMIEDIDD